jgi:hypothetical protein
MEPWPSGPLSISKNSEPSSAIERYVVCPIARLLATAQVRSGDVLLIDRHPGEEELAFIRDAEQCSSYAPMPHAAAYLMHLRLQKFEVK